jgi:hypothetical protein
MMKSISPKPTPLQVALENYNTLLNNLTIADQNFTKQQGLELLTARDFLQKQLEANSPVSAKIWTALTEQDARLKKQAYKTLKFLIWLNIGRVY